MESSLHNRETERMRAPTQTTLYEDPSGSRLRQLEMDLARALDPVPLSEDPNGSRVPLNDRQGVLRPWNPPRQLSAALRHALGMSGRPQAEPWDSNSAAVGADTEAAAVSGNASLCHPSLGTSQPLVEERMPSGQPRGLLPADAPCATAATTAVAAAEGADAASRALAPATSAHGSAAATATRRLPPAAAAGGFAAAAASRMLHYRSAAALSTIDLQQQQRRSRRQRTSEHGGSVTKTGTIAVNPA